jgi:hypothetical protein
MRLLQIFAAIIILEMLIHLAMKFVNSINTIDVFIPKYLDALGSLIESQMMYVVFLYVVIQMFNKD